MEQWYKEELADETLINPDGDITEIENAVSSCLVDRAYTWIKAHTPATKNPPSQTQKVIDDIKHWSEMAKNGEFVPTRLEDVLVKATGKYDHPRRTRGVGSHVGLQQYFGKPTSRAPRGNLYTLDELNSFKEEVKRETMDEMKVIMNQQLSEILKACGVQLPREFEVNLRDSPLLSRRRDQSSCHSAKLNDPFKELRVPTACRLAVLEFENLITVAEWMVWPWVEGKKVHNTPLSPQNVQVSIDKIIESTAPLPVPWDGFQRVGEVLGSFAQWPKQLVLLGLDESKSNNNVRKMPNQKRQKSLATSVNRLSMMFHKILPRPWVLFWGFYIRINPASNAGIGGGSYKSGVVSFILGLLAASMATVGWFLESRNHHDRWRVIVGEAVDFVFHFVRRGSRRGELHFSPVGGAFLSWWVLVIPEWLSQSWA
ncbi:hypothetical protein RND81_11G067900 [Saponaria officinalis]|uniref:DUF8039 domain-containing protein n=1 Tax=Saponaria officinalis TaxID=3572 RepID=A0AAW1HIQ5_SAPOF